jgi:hypothetical protein
MKPWNLWKLGAGVLLTLAPLGSRGAELTSETTPPALSSETAAQAEPAATDILTAPPDAPEASGAPTSDITKAPEKSVISEKPLPTHIRPDSSLAEVVKLANAGLDQSVMLAFVTNSTHTFNLGAEDIVYLNDIGVPSTVVTSMIQRDQELRTAGAAFVGSAPATLDPTGGVTPQTLVPPPYEPMPQPVAPPSMETADAVPEAPPGADESSDASFYDSLSPYGNWTDLQGYGWCWQPTVVVVNPYWQPYYNCGHWVYSNCGWYWCSSYSWGWAPFHYGRWFRHHHLGWCWMPDKVWGPSWVSWRYGDHYCGWAPLPPGSHFSAAVGLTYHGQHVREYEDCGQGATNYRFVTWDHLQDRQLSDHRLPANQAAWAYNNSTPRTRISGDGHSIVNNGLSASRVTVATGKPVMMVSLRDLAPRSSPMEHYDPSAQTLDVYRPKLGPTPPARNPVSGKRAEASPGTTTDVRSSTAAPWLNHDALATVTPGHLNDSVIQGGAREQPLILHGAQPSALRETAPQSSLIVIGRKDANGRYVTTMTAAEAQGQVAARTETGVAPNVGSRSGQQVPLRTAGDEAWQRNLPWLAQREQQTVPLDQASPAERPDVPRYAAPTWRSQAEVPRYGQAPTYPQRSYSAPNTSARQPQADYHPAPAAPSAPAAHAQQASPAQRTAR